MKKRFLAALLLAVCAALSFAEEKKPEFSAKLIPTRAVNIGDQFEGILPNRPSFFPIVSKVACGEPFRVEVTFMGAQIKNGEMQVKGNIVIADPNGKKNEIPLECRISKVSGDTTGVFLLPKTLQVYFEPNDPKGKHTFDLELTDCCSGKMAKASASVEYGEKAVAAPGENAFAKIQSYYLSQQPEYILPAFQEYLKNLPKQKAKEKANFNPLPQLAFFVFLLQENPQLVSDFAAGTKTLNGEEKFMADVVLNFVSEDAAKYLTSEERAAVQKRFAESPFRIEKVMHPAQLDICWAEFLVRATRPPVMKIVQSMSLASDSIPLDQFKKIPKPTQEEKRKLLNSLTVMAAHWSMTSLAKRHSLIRFYVEAALARKEVKSPIAAALAAEAIGLKAETPQK